MSVNKNKNLVKKLVIIFVIVICMLNYVWIRHKMLMSNNMISSMNHFMHYNLNKNNDSNNNNNNNVNRKEIYSIMVSSCESFIPAIIQLLQLMKYNDNHLIIIWWYYKEYNQTKHDIQLKMLYKYICNEFKSLKYFDANKFEILPLILNKSIYIPDYWLKNHWNERKFYGSWKIAFNKINFYGYYNRFNKIISLDNDLFFVEPINDIFNINKQSFVRQTGRDFINGGVSVIIPSKSIFDKIVNKITYIIDSYNKTLLNKYFGTAEQTFLEEFLKENNLLNIMNHKWNSNFADCNKVNGSYKDIHIWHWSPSPKPWTMVIYNNTLNKWILNNNIGFIRKILNRNNDNCLVVIINKWLMFYNSIYNYLNITNQYCLNSIH